MKRLQSLLRCIGGGKRPTQRTENIFFKNTGCKDRKAADPIRSNLGDPGSFWMSDASRTPEEPAFPPVPRCEPRPLEKRHNNPRRLLFGPSAVETAPGPFGENRTAGRLSQAPSVLAGGPACGDARLLMTLMSTVQLGSARAPPRPPGRAAGSALAPSPPRVRHWGRVRGRMGMRALGRVRRCESPPPRELLRSQYYS